MEQLFGAGIIGVHAFEGERGVTGLFTVMPTAVLQLKEGFYQFTYQKGIYTNMNPQLTINSYTHVTHREYGELVKEPVVGMGITGLMTAPIWAYKPLKSLF